MIIEAVLLSETTSCVCAFVLTLCGREKPCLAQGAAFILAIFVPERVYLAEKDKQHAMCLIFQEQNV
jgi:hypothetical protein